MKASTIQLLKDSASDWHFSNQILATPEDIDLFEREKEKIHPGYIPYLKEVGFEVVGSEYFDRIKELREHAEHMKSNWEIDPDGKIKECFVFHWDGCGNPVGISWDDNKVYVDDHDFGSGMCLSESIDDYVLKLLNE